MKFQMNPNLSKTFNIQTPAAKRNQMKTSIDQTIMKDNPNNQNIGEISKYIQQLDYRLSIPKFTKDSDLTENQKLFKIGNGIRNEHMQVTKSRLR